MTVIRPRDGARHYGRTRPSAAARVRAEGEDFTASFIKLQDAVRDACTAETQWEARIVAGIKAALAFVAAEPGKAKALTLKARLPGPGERDNEREVIAYFAGLLHEVAPAEKRFPVSTDEGIVEAVATVIRGHLLGGTADQLPAIAPDLVYLALMPYLGLAATRRWVDTISPVEH